MAVVRWNGDQITQNIRDAAMRAIIRGTESVRTEAIRLILTTPKSGRTYRRRGVVHQASAPGEPPASDTGRLVNAIETRYNVDEVSGTVNFGAAHAPHLEFGTENMEPRPFARPALDNKRDEINEDVAREIRGALL